jgi:hypothetical protein
MSFYDDTRELIDLAQQVMDGTRDGGIGAAMIASGGNRAAEMMAGMPPHVCALLWALIRCSEGSDRHFGLLHLMLTNAIRQAIVDTGPRFDDAKVKAVAKGVARAALHQYLFSKGKCKKCDGTGMVKDPLSSQAHICSACEGAGDARYTQAERWRLSALPIARQSYVDSCERFELQCGVLLEDWRVVLDGYLMRYFASDRSSAH